MTDHLGSTTVITDHAGQIVQRLSYKPFGGLNGPAPSDGAALHHYFTGGELDGETGLYHLGARYYDPALGRFTQPDPITQNLYDPQSLNPYSYARNNPLRLIDPTGLSFQSGFGSFGGGFGGFGNVDLTRPLQDFSRQSQQSWSDFVSGRTVPLPSSSLNQTTTLAMQSFSRTGSSLGSSPFGGFSSPFTDPFRSPTRFSASYREITSPGLGTTTTLLSGSFPTPVQPILPQTPFIEAFQQANQALQTVEQGLRGVWGGLSPNVRLDIGGAIGEFASIFSSSPTVRLAGHLVGATANVAGTVITFQQWQAGQATWYDVSVSLVTTSLGFARGPIGLVASTGQLAYDLMMERARP